ncbi:hypothetical protein EMCRGX_G002072, partial [Ephydatia muelleri]
RTFPRTTFFDLLARPYVRCIIRTARACLSTNSIIAITTNMATTFNVITINIITMSTTTNIHIVAVLVLPSKSKSKPSPYTPWTHHFFGTPCTSSLFAMLLICSELHERVADSFFLFSTQA